MTPDRVERLVGEPAAGGFERLLAGEDLPPVHAALAAGGALHGRVEHAAGRPPDVRPRPVPFNEGNDGLLRNDPAAALVIDRIAHVPHAPVGRRRAVYTLAAGLRQRNARRRL